MTGELAGLFRNAPRVGLDDLGDADLQQRIDLKYVIDRAVLERLAAGLSRSHGLLSVNGLVAFTYRSSYLDSADLGCFQAHRQGRRLRWKARSRLYVDSSRCRFEVKLKTGRGETDKHAVLIPAEEFGRYPQQARALLTQLLADRYRLPAPQALAPSLTVQHRRSTLVATDGTGRLTLDSALTFAAPDGSAGQLRDGLVLLETKSRDGRSAADRLLRQAGVRPVSVSKYCSGIALTRPEQNDQPWRRLLREAFVQPEQIEVAA